MNRMLSSFVTGSILAAGLLAAPTGCKSNPFASKSLSATVTVPFDEAGEDRDVTVESSSKEDSMNGVKYLDAGAWNDAIARFEAAVAAGDDDPRTHFALGVAYEVTGRLQDAKSQYMKAIDASEELNSEYTIALKRVRVKLGEDAL